MTTIQRFRSDGPYQCAVLATSWFCNAFLEAELVDKISAENRLVLIDEPNLAVTYIKKGAGAAEDNFFKRGLLWARQHLGSDKRFDVDIKRVNFNECDFQPEILFFLSAGWLLGIVAHEELQFEWSFDKITHRYNFVFPDEAS